MNLILFTIITISLCILFGWLGMEIGATSECYKCYKLEDADKLNKSLQWRFDSLNRECTYCINECKNCEKIDPKKNQYTINLNYKEVLK